MELDEKIETNTNENIDAESSELQITWYDRAAGSADRFIVIVEKLKVIRKNLAFFLTSLLILVGISTLIVFLLPKRYEAVATLMPPNDTSMSLLTMLMGGQSSGGGAEAAGRPGGGSALSSILGLGTQGQLFVRVAGSRTIEDRMIQRFDLMNLYGTKYIEDCRKEFESDTDVEEDRKSGAIDITVRDRDPHRAAAMANAYVEELNRLMLEIDSASARQEREVTGIRVEEAARAWEEATNGLAQFASRNTTLEPNEQGKAAVELSAEIEGELIAAETDLKSLEQLYTPNNQRVYSARARVEELRKQLDKANSAGLSGNDTQGSLPSVRKLPLLGAKYLDLYRKVKIQEAVLTVLSQEYELARIRENHQVSTVRVMEYAAVPTKKSFPPRSIFLLILSILSLCTATCVVFVVDWWKTLDENDKWRLLLFRVRDAVKS